MHFSSPSDCSTAADALRRMKHPAISLEPVEVDDDGQHWAERCQARLRAVRVGRLVIAPPWDVPPDPPDASIVVIRPSMGFGTGHHASTRLCLRALQDGPVVEKTVIDLGTGSGVLAIAAAKLGATLVLAIDSDHDALRCARQNVTANLVSPTVKTAAADMRRTAFSRPAQVVLANLTGELLIRTARTVASYAGAGGRFVLSGFTTAEVDRVEEAFAPHICARRRLCEDEWACLIMELPE